MLINKNSTTPQDERGRLGSHESTKSYLKPFKKYGRIDKIHETLYAVTVTLVDGGDAFSGRFLPVINPWQELIHDYGTLRPGLLVELTYNNEQERYAQVKVIGLENETVASIQQQPTVDLSIYEIFTPGI